MGFRILKYRFSVERMSDGKYVVVDWARGLFHPAGIGGREEQEGALTFIKAYVRKHGDANLTRLPKRLSTSPRWPGGMVPAYRAGWQLEQRSIAMAYARIGEIAREKKLNDLEMSRDQEIVLAKRRAERLYAEARARVGLP